MDVDLLNIYELKAKLDEVSQAAHNAIIPRRAAKKAKLDAEVGLRLLNREAVDAVLDVINRYRDRIEAAEKKLADDDLAYKDLRNTRKFLKKKEEDARTVFNAAAFKLLPLREITVSSYAELKGVAAVHEECSWKGLVKTPSTLDPTTFNSLRDLAAENNLHLVQIVEDKLDLTVMI